VNVEDKISLGDKKRPRGKNKKKISKPKVLFVGPYRQTNNWGHLSRGVLKALCMIENAVITARPVFLEGNTTYLQVVDQDILQAEMNKQDKYDILIQYVPPNHMVINGEFKTSIGILHLETLNNSEWDNYLRLVDKILVLTSAEKNAMSIDLQAKTYSIGGSLLPGVGGNGGAAGGTITGDSVFGLNPQDGGFSFYFFCEKADSKSGIDVLLQSYMSEFTSDDNVSLTIYTEQSEVLHQRRQEMSGVLGLYGGMSYYPKISVLTPYDEIEQHGIDTSDMLHANCQCLIDPSGINGFKKHVAQAFAYGNPAIVVEGTSMCQYVNVSNGWIIDSHKEMLICPDRPMKDIFTARENYLSPNKISLKKAMREAFENKILYLRKSKAAKNSQEEFSLEKQSQALRDILCF